MIFSAILTLGYYYASCTNFNNKNGASYWKRRKLFRTGATFTDEARPFCGILYTDLNREVYSIITQFSCNLLFSIVFL